MPRLTVAVRDLIANEYVRLCACYNKEKERYNKDVSCHDDDCFINLHRQFMDNAQGRIEGFIVGLALMGVATAADQENNFYTRVYVQDVSYAVTYVPQCTEVA